MTPALLTIVLFAATSGSPSEAVSRAHFAKAQKAFAAHDWRHALDEFTAAGESSPSEIPDLWFDIGQCQRNLGHPRQAAAAFERYLSLKPDAADRERVRGLIVALGGKPPAPPVEAAPPVEDPPPATVTAPASVVAPAPAIAAPPVEPQPIAAALPLVPANDAPLPPPRKAHRHWKIWTGVAVAVAVVAVGVGLGVGLGTAGSSGGGSGTMASTPSLGSAGTFDTRNH